VSDDDYFVSNAVGYLIEDLGDDERYAMMSDAQRTAALVWVLDGLIRGDGVEGWIESLGQRSDDAVAALRTLGASAQAAILDQAFQLYPTRAESDAEGRLAAVDAWSSSELHAWRDLEDRYLEVIKADDLIDNYVRPYIEARPEEFPQTVDDI
jgi:Domain of unknown function (DUF4375)